MATSHTLKLTIPETACTTVLRVMDMSVYVDGVAYASPKLEITLPGFTLPVEITTGLAQVFSKNFTAIDMGLQTDADEALRSLPDGLYKVKYSIAPNTTNFVEYYHLRTTSIMNDYYKEICKVQLDACEPTEAQHQKLHDLRYIKMFIDAAKAKAEYCHAPQQAIEMLVYAEKLLSKYKTGSCLTCCN